MIYHPRMRVNVCETRGLLRPWRHQWRVFAASRGTQLHLMNLSVRDAEIHVRQERRNTFKLYVAKHLIRGGGTERDEILDIH